MTLDEVKEAWREDCKLDLTQLDEESARSMRLHSKYFDIYCEERLILKKINLAHKQVQLEKYEFYTQGASKEQNDKGWKNPSKGLIVLKSEVGRYLEADPELAKHSFKIECQQVKLDFLKSIIDNINRRGLQIKNANEFIRWTNGG